MALINDAPQPPDGSTRMSSPILAAAEQKIEAGIAPDNKQNWQKIVVAGMAAALARGPEGLLASLAKSPDPVRDAAKGAVALVLILRHQAKGVMPEKAMVPAAMTLMLHALDFVNRSTNVKIGTDELVRATHIFADSMFAAFHITAPMLHTVAARVHAVTADPRAMAAIRLKAGIDRAPSTTAPTPTPLPAA